MKPDIEVRIYETPGMFKNTVALYRRLPTGLVELTLADGTTEVLNPMESNQRAFTFMATDQELRALFYDLKEYLRIGEDRNYTDGKLTATEKHLEDMRTLVFNEEREVTEAAPVQKNKRVVITETYDDPGILETADRPLNTERE